MMDRNQRIIHHSELVSKLMGIKAQCDGDVARVIELLLLENHVLSLDQSSGFRRGITMDFSGFPRFLKLEEVDVPVTAEG